MRVPGARNVEVGRREEVVAEMIEGFAEVE